MPLELTQLITCLQEGDGRGVDTLDQRFQDIASLIEQADYAQAAAKCQETFSEGQADIRLVSWFFFGLFLQDGAAGLAPLLQTATTAFRERFAAVGPEKKKEHHATAGMAWFLSKLADRVANDDAEKAAEAERLKGQVDLEQVTAAIEALDQLGEAFTAAVPLNPQKVNDPLRRAREWLTGLQSDLTVPDEPEPTAEAPVEAAGADAPAATHADARPSAPSGVPMVEASFRMLELQARMAAFETLVARGDVAKAALIASDVMRVVEHFDPRLYLPRLFSSFFSLLAPRTIDMFTYQEKRGTAAWKVFDQLYRTDLDAYVRCSEGDFQRMLASSSPSDGGMGNGGGGGGQGHGNGNGGGGGDSYGGSSDVSSEPSSPAAVESDW